MKELPEGSLPGHTVAGRGSEGRGPDARSAALGSRSTVYPRPPGPAPRRPQLLPKPARSDWCLPLALVCQARACEGIERSVTSVTRTPCPVFLLTRGAVLKPPHWKCSMQERSQTPEPRPLPVTAWDLSRAQPNLSGWDLPLLVPPSSRVPEAGIPER